MGQKLKRQHALRAVGPKPRNPSKYRALKPDSKKNFSGPEKFFFESCFRKLQNNMFLGAQLILLCWRTQAFQSATSNPSKYRALKPDSKKNFSGPEKFFFESCFRKLQNNMFLGAQLILLCWRTQAFQSATSNPSKYRALKPDSKKNFSGPEKFFFESCFRKLQTNMFLGTQLILLCWRTHP